MIVLGLTVFNRYHLFAHSAASLRPLLTDDCKLVVLNDGSTEFSEQEIVRLLPGAVVHSNARNSGRADYAAIQLASLLLEHDAPYAAMLDSDLMCHSGFVKTVLAAMPLTDGLLSALNADSHPLCSDERTPIEVVGNVLVTKNAVGNAGTIWTRELLAEVVRNVPASPTWDWDYSAYVRATGRNVFCLERSAVQHLGFWVGQNSRAMNGDWGLGYPALSGTESSVVAEMIFLGTKTAFAHVAQDRPTRYISAHHFRPFGGVRGRGRVFSLRQPLLVQTETFLGEGYHHLYLEAVARHAVASLFLRGSARLELSVTIGGRVVVQAAVPLHRLAGPGADAGLRLEFDNPRAGPACVAISYRGPRRRGELEIRGLFVDCLSSPAPDR